MAGPQEIQNSLLTAGFARVARLCDAGQLHDALAEAVTLYERFPHAPASCTGLVDTLLVMGRTDMAQTVLRRACQRFPGESWLSLRLAEICSERGQWAEAVTRWRAAGLPVQGSANQLARFAHVLAASGQIEDALAAASMPGRDSASLRLTRAALLVRTGHLDQAALLWRDLSVDFTLAEPEFAGITAALASQAPAVEQAAMIGMLLAERDPGGEDWRPAIAAAMANVLPGEPFAALVLAALPSAPSGTARAVAARLAGESVGSDKMALQISACVAAGRVGLVPLLVETPGTSERVAELRVALRLYLNRAFANPEHFHELSAESVCALLQIARVADQACFNFVAELVRGRFALPAELDLSRPADVAAGVAHARPRPSTLSAGKLRVAVCVSGRIPPVLGSPEPLRALGLQDHDATVFAHIWRNCGPETGLPSVEAAVLHLPPTLGATIAAVAETEGLATLRALYPSVMQSLPARRDVDTNMVQQTLLTEHVVVEDDLSPEFAGRDVAWLAAYSARQSYLMAQACGGQFDVMVYLMANAGVGISANWPVLARDLRLFSHHGGGMMFADANYQFDRAAGFSLVPKLAIATPEVMEMMAGAFDFGCDLAMGTRKVFGVRPADAMAQSLAWQMHLNGISIEMLDGLLVSAGTKVERWPAAHALSLLWRDIRARAGSPRDSQLVNAAMADLTGGAAV